MVRSFVLQLFLTLTLQLSPIQNQQLETGKQLEAELAGSQSHSYQVMLKAGQYLSVVVDQRGIDVALAIFAPDGKKMAEVDSPTGNEGPETLTVISEAAGQHRIEVRSDDAAAPKGRYLVKIAELKEATARDRDRVAADAIFREAVQLRAGTEGEKRRGIDKYQEALSLYRRAGDRKGETMTLADIGFVHNSLGETQLALEWFNQALPISREIRSRVDEAAILNNIGLTYDRLGDRQKALEYYNQALPIRREVGERQPEAITLNNIASVYYKLGDLQKALVYFNQALLLVRAIGDRYTEADTLSNIGVAYSGMGELQKALDNYKESVALRLTIGDRAGAAVAITNIGAAYDSMGELERALENYNEALKILRASGNRYGEAITLQNIGKTYRSMGEMQKALEYFDRALTIKRAVGDRSGEAVTLNSIGKVYQTLGEIPKALENFNAALQISQTFIDRSAEANALQNIGMANNSVGETRKALESLNGALQIRRAAGDRIGESDTLLGIARVEEKSGNMIEARRTIEQAIEIVESVRTRIDSQRLRTSYFATQQEFYQAQIDILMQLHRQNPLAAYDAEALSASERARARSLLELLNEARIDLRQGVDSSLLAREHSLQQRLSTKAADQSNRLGGIHTAEQAEAMAGEIAAITAEYDDVEAQIRASSPQYAALTQPQPLNLKEIQKQLLDPETLLLEYSLGENVSHLFVVSDTSITSYQLPNRAEIETATRLVRDLLTAPEHRPGDSSISILARTAKARKDYWPAAAALSRMLLDPAASQLGTKRLLLVTDGALQYLPFGTLPIPEGESGRGGERESGRAGERESGRGGERERGRARERGKRKSITTDRPSLSRSPAPPLSRSPTYPTPLIVKHEIIHLPSASSLAVLRRELSERKPAPKMVAILADPVFSIDDSRVKLAGQHRAEDGILAHSDLPRAVNDVRGELKRLLMTREEAQAISSILPPKEQLEALDFRANRALCTSDALSQYRIVHFATHGLLDSEHPYLSGLVLSLVNEKGQPQDGFLRLPEIFNLRLPADLVVLSACQTGLGKEIKGEGLIGLTRGFMYAGAVRVIASLWQVDDLATAELMKSFYRRMIQEKMRPAAALRAAQIEMLKKSQWDAPFYWGAFVLQGEWK